MHEGVVQSSGDATVELQLRGPSGKVAWLKITVDTGLTQSLIVPPRMAIALDLEVRELTSYTLADGSTVDAPVYALEGSWFGGWAPVAAGCMDRGALLGMQLMSGCRLCLDVVEGGSVWIDRLP